MQSTFLCNHTEGVKPWYILDTRSSVVLTMHSIRSKVLQFCKWVRERERPREHVIEYILLSNSFFNWQPRNVLAHTHKHSTDTDAGTNTSNQIVIYFVRQSNSHFISISIFADRHHLGIQSTNITKIDLHNDFSKSFASVFGIHVHLCSQLVSVIFVWALVVRLISFLPFDWLTERPYSVQLICFDGVKKCFSVPSYLAMCEWKQINITTKSTAQRLLQSKEIYWFRSFIHSFILFKRILKSVAPNCVHQIKSLSIRLSSAML